MDERKNNQITLITVENTLSMISITWAGGGELILFFLSHIKIISLLYLSLLSHFLLHHSFPFFIPSFSPPPFSVPLSAQDNLFSPLSHSLFAILSPFSSSHILPPFSLLLCTQGNYFSPLSHFPLCHSLSFFTSSSPPS